MIKEGPLVEFHKDHKSDNYWYFNIVMFESPEVCSSFNVEIEVYEKNSSPDSRLSAKLRSKPSSIDEPRQRNIILNHPVVGEGGGVKPLHLAKNGEEN